MSTLHVCRDDLATTELHVGRVTPADLREGEALLEVEHFAMSANNVTYGVLGDGLGYWKLFPAPDGWGAVPAWGHARIVASRAPVVDEGRRVLGLVPMADQFVVRPAAQPGGFTDTAEHRAELSPVYNRYIDLEDADEAALIMRPLFATALVVRMVLSEAGFDGADTVVLTSASSKTAYALAHLMRDDPVRVVGLTSASRTGWVEGLGLYDEVLSYEDAASLAAPGGAVLVDFAGRRPTVRAVHEALGAALRRSMIVGITDWRAATSGEDPDPLPGPEPALFFAPTEMATRGAALQAAYGPAWTAFAASTGAAMRVEAVVGADALRTLWADLLAGRADPAAGFVARL